MMSFLLILFLVDELPSVQLHEKSLLWGRYIRWSTCFYEFDGSLTSRHQHLANLKLHKKNLKLIPQKETNEKRPKTQPSLPSLFSTQKNPTSKNDRPSNPHRIRCQWIDWNICRVPVSWKLAPARTPFAV